MSITISQILAASPHTERGRPSQLSADPKGEYIAYASGKSVFLRSIDNPSLSKQYTAHNFQTTVARFSPSGYYVASGDTSGLVKIWDALECVNTKGEYQITSGRINDIAWDHDSQRIIAVGDGRNRYGHCITADSGNSVGEICGHALAINSVSIRQKRPLRAATGADDSNVVFFHGTPFKFARKLLGLHKGYIYGVDFSPDGNKLISVGADRRIQLYNGESGEPEIEIGKNEHKGSIFGFSWHYDSKKFVTASADQTVKLWDLETGKTVQTWKFNNEGKNIIINQQVGVVWPATRKDGTIISLNLAGDLSYLVEGNDKPIRVISGHNKNISAMGSSHNHNGQTLWTGSLEGKVCSWEVNSGIASVVQGECHKNQIIAFQSSKEQIYSIGWDDTVRITDIHTNTFREELFKISAQPRGLALAEGRILIIHANGVQIYSKNEFIMEFPTKDYTPTAIAASRNLVAIGNDLNTVKIFTLDGNHQLTWKKDLHLSRAPITALSFSENGELLAVGDSAGKIVVYESESWVLKTDRWSAHTARIISIAWNAKGTYLVSGGLDSNIFVWSLQDPGNRIVAHRAHKGIVNGVFWLNSDSKIASTGEDATLKI